MILILGASGYIGQAFVDELSRRQRSFVALSRRTVDYACYNTFRSWLREHRPECVINAAGFTGKPNVDACETARAETIEGNVVLAATLAHACSAEGVVLGHVSSGCIYAGAHVLQNSRWSVERDLMAPELARLRFQNPAAFRGFVESDPPNFSFRSPPCSFYSGSKALGEESVRKGIEQHYIFRLRMPFDHIDGPRNLLTKLNRYPRIYDNVNSLTHRGDFVRACIDVISSKAPYGTYNVTHPGMITNREIAETLKRVWKQDRELEFFAGDSEFYGSAAKAPRSNCLLSSEKLAGVGIVMRPVQEALDDAIRTWVPATR